MIVINVTENKLVYRAKGQKYELLPGVGISVDDPRVVEAMKGFYKHSINVVDENVGADLYEKAIEDAKVQEKPIKEPEENTPEGTVVVEGDNANSEGEKEDGTEGTMETNTEGEGTSDNTQGTVNPEGEGKAEIKAEVKVPAEKKAKQTKNKATKSQSKKNKNSKK